MNSTSVSPTTENSEFRHNRLVLILLVGLGLRLAITPFNGIEGLLNPDHIHCWEQGNVARSLVAGHGFGSPMVSTQLSAIMPPVFPLIVAGFFKLFGVHTVASIFAVHAFNCVVSVLATIPIFLLARRTFNERVAWWSAWAWALSPYGIYFAAAWAWSTHILLLCLCWMLYLAQDIEKSPKLSLWAGFGLLAGFAALTEPSVLVTLPVLMGVGMWRLLRAGKRWFMPGLVASLVVVAMLTPWTVRNAMVFHKFIPMRDSMGLELWMGNNGQSLHWTSDYLHPLHDKEELAEYNRVGELAYMQHKSEQAKAVIAAHPGWYAGMCVRRAVFIWTGFWSFNRTYLAEEPTDQANIPYSTVYTLLALSGLVLMWRQRRWDAVRFAGVMLVMPAIYYFAHPEPYHLRPLDPLLTMLACYAILCWRTRLSESTEAGKLLAVVTPVES